jgi:hypothetical protein
MIVVIGRRKMEGMMDAKQMEEYFDDYKTAILISMELTEHPCEPDENNEWLIEKLKEIFLDGRREQARMDKEAVGGVIIDCCKSGYWHLGQARFALSLAEPESK